MIIIQYLAITGQGWAKYCDLPVASRSIICRSRRLRRTIDLQDTDESWYFVLTEFNIVLSFDHQVSFHILTTSWQLRVAICHFSLENVVPLTHEQHIICSKAHLGGTMHEQTIICRQLFAGHMMDSRPTERKKKTHRMIMYSYLQVTWWTLGQWKGRKKRIEW